MKEKNIGKALAVAVIILFIGVGVQPTFAVDVSTSNSDNEANCNLCAKKVSKSHLILIKSLLNRLEKSKGFNFDTSYLDSTDICDKLEKLIMVLMIPLLVLEPILDNMDDGTIIFNLLASVYMLYAVVAYAFPVFLYVCVFECYEFNRS